MNGASFYRPSTALDAMTGKRMPGGCEDCTAYQTVRQTSPGIYSLAVHHDSTCPTYRAIVTKRRTLARERKSK